MSKELTVCDITFEVTRKYNNQSKQGLRGFSENIDMNQRIAEEALKDIVSIGSLSFVGGEPTLNVDIIRGIVNHIIRNEIHINNFSISTNGTCYSEELVDSLYELYDYITENYGDCDMCKLVIESNQLQQTNPNIVSKYSKLPFYNNYNDLCELERNMLYLNISLKNATDKLDIEVSEYAINVNSGNIYINALGDVLFNSNLEYDNQTKYKKGNILENSLVDILLK